MAIQAEIIPFILLTGVGTQTISHIRFPAVTGKAFIFLSTDPSGTNSHASYSFGIDDGITHIGSGMGISDTFGINTSARGYSTQFSLVTEQAQIFFGGAQMRFRGYVSATRVGSFDITTDLNNTPGAQWYAVVISGVSAVVGVVSPESGMPQTIALGFTPAAFLTLNCPVPGSTGEVSGAILDYGFAGPCHTTQVSWGVAAGSSGTDARSFQLTGIVDATLVPTAAVGSAPTEQRFISAYPANAFTIDGSSVTPFADRRVGYLAIGGSGVSANLVSFNQSSGTGIQNIAIDAGNPQFALFASTNKPTSAGVTLDLNASFGVFDGLNNLSVWMGEVNGTFSRHSRASTTKCLTLATATGSSVSVVNADAAMSGLTSQNVALNWTTVDATAREVWMLVFANDPGTGVCGAPVPPSPCGPSAPAIPSNPVSPIGGGGSASGSGGVIV